MGYSTFEDQWRTLQIDYSFFNPRFQVSGRVYEDIGYGDWLIAESGSLSDNVFSPGEYVVLYNFNSFTGTFDASGTQVTYEGRVDLNGDTFFDGVIVSRFGQEYILTDANAYMDFTPYSTQVDLYKVSLNTEYLSTPAPPAQPQYNFISGTNRRDTLIGTFLDDSIIGLKGADSINGKKGDDLLDGGHGNDLIVGGGGADSIWGGKGRDTLKGGGGPDDFWIDTKHMHDIILAFQGSDTLVVDTSVRAFRGVELDDIRIRHTADFDKIFVDGDLVAKVFGADVGMNDVFLL